MVWHENCGNAEPISILISINIFWNKILCIYNVLHRYNFLYDFHLLWHSEGHSIPLVLTLSSHLTWILWLQIIRAQPTRVISDYPLSRGNKNKRFVFFSRWVSYSPASLLERLSVFIMSISSPLGCGVSSWRFILLCTRSSKSKVFLFNES